MIKKVRLFISLYSIILSFIGAIYYIKILLFKFDAISYYELILFYTVACMYSLLIITNFSLIINKSYLTFSLKYSMFFYSTQIFDFTLFNLSYEFSCGIRTAIYFVLYDGYSIEFNMGIIKNTFRIVYPAISNGIFLGINFIPVLLICLYLYIYMKSKKSVH